MKMTLVFFLSLIPGSVLSADYSEFRATAIKNCESINPREYQSGLIFNPDGYRSYYVRSECFQRAAVQFRDEALCKKVIRRYSLFSSSWGYSENQCRKLVTEGISADRSALEKVKREYLSSPMRLRDFHIERNGNGRDFDIIPSFSGDYSHGYTLRFEFLQPGPNRNAVTLQSSGYYVDSNANLRIFLRQEDIRKRFAGFSLNRSYTVQGSIILDIGYGGPAGFWSDTFIQHVFPEEQRSHSLKKEIRF